MMQRYSPWFVVLAIMGATAVSMRPASAGPIFLPQPGYQVRISSATSPTFGSSGPFGDSVPISAAYDASAVDSVGLFRQVAATAETFATPLATVQGASTYAQLQAEATVGYHVGVAPLPGFATGIKVPVIISSAGSVSAETIDSLGGSGTVFAEVSMTFQFNTLFSAFASSNDDNPSSSDSYSGIVTRDITAGSSAAVSILARGSIPGSEVGRRLTSGEFQAVIDPFFEIDPDATFPFDGMATRFADAYFVVVSDGVENHPSDGAPVPEPCSLVLFACGLIGLSGYGSFRHMSATTRSGRPFRVPDLERTEP